MRRAITIITSAALISACGGLANEAPGAAGEGARAGGTGGAASATESAGTGTVEFAGNGTTAGAGAAGETGGADSGGAGGVTTGGEGGVGGTEPAGVACGPGACCIPVQVDGAATRAYLVNGELYLDLAIVPSYGPDAADGYWWSAAEVVLNDGSQQECRMMGSMIMGEPGAQYASCAPVPSTEVVCGDAVRVEVRLTSSTQTPEGLDACTSDGPGGDAVAFDVNVLCPSCPAEPFDRTACEYPIRASCPAEAYDHWHGVMATVHCTCQRPDGVWGCPVF